MSDAVSKHLHTSLHKTFEWLRDVGLALGTDDRQVASHVLRSVLHALRDRLIPEEASHFAQQLPGPLRGIFFEGWSPAHKPVKMSRRAFVARIAEELDAIPCDRCATDSIRAVFRVLQARISQGEIADVRGALPKDYAPLWNPPSPVTKQAWEPGR